MKRAKQRSKYSLNKKFAWQRLGRCMSGMVLRKCSQVGFTRRILRSEHNEQALP